MTEHHHEPVQHSAVKISGGGSIAMETCRCGAMRSVVVRKAGDTITSDWVTEDDEVAGEVLDAEPDNTNDEDRSL